MLETNITLNNKLL